MAWVTGPWAVGVPIGLIGRTFCGDPHSSTRHILYGWRQEAGRDWHTGATAAVSGVWVVRRSCRRRLVGLAGVDWGNCRTHCYRILNHWFAARQMAAGRLWRLTKFPIEDSALDG